MRSNQRINRIPAGLRALAIVLALMVGMHGLTPSSYGNPIMSEPISIEDAREGDLATIQQMLEMKVVQHRLETLGFTQGQNSLPLGS